MQIIVIEEKTALTKYLKATGFSVLQFNPKTVRSLTGLLMEHTSVRGLVIQDESTTIWSAAHLLAAAKQLQNTGNTVLIGSGKLTEQCGRSDLICIAQAKEDIPALLRKPPKKATGSRSVFPVPRIHPPDYAVPATAKTAQIEPLQVPADKIVFIGVIGSQPRIGCTTQAIGLWHYCKSLGFSPAVVADSEQIAQIAGTMRTQEIDGGYEVEGIPFVADTALSYDCYILDIGVGSIADALKAVDCPVLVAGSKPWELQNTAAALRAARNSKINILLSFTTQKDGEALLPLFGSNAALVAPWMPDIWRPPLEVLAVYDTLLRTALQVILSRSEPVPQAEEAVLEKVSLAPGSPMRF